MVRRADRTARALERSRHDSASRASQSWCPRFSNVALVSVVLLLASGTWATINHLPAINALWETGFGEAILVKTGLLIAAMLLASGNLLRPSPSCAAAGGSDGGEPAPGCVRSSAARPRSSRGGVRRRGADQPGPAAAGVLARELRRRERRPRRVAHTVTRAGYVLQVLVTPNKAAAPNSFALRITKNGQPVRGANVTLTLNHTEMQMPQQEYQLDRDPARRLLTRRARARDGRQMGARVPDHPKNGPAFTALILDQANG